MKKDFFSIRGSYIYLLDKPYQGKRTLFIRSNYGGSSNHAAGGGLAPTFSSALALAVNPVWKGEKTEFEIQYETDGVQCRHEQGDYIVSLADQNTVIVEGKSRDLSILLDVMPMNGSRKGMEYIIRTEKNGEEYYILNCYRSNMKYYVYVLDGTTELQQNLKGDIYNLEYELFSRLKIEPVNGKCRFAIVEIPHHFLNLKPVEFDMNQCRAKIRADFRSFYEAFPEAADRWKDAYETAVHCLWSNIVSKKGELDYDMVSWGAEQVGQWSLCAVYSDLGLVKAYPRMAYEQLKIFFDKQDELGCMPGSLSDSGTRWMFLKPPVQGLYLDYLIRDIKPDDSEKRYLYEHMRRLVEYYLNYLDSDGDGICEYQHVNDSCMDDMPLFDEHVITDTPDLTAYMIRNMDVLSELAEQLGDSEGSHYWKQKADKTMKKALEYFVVDGELVARNTLTKECIPNQSLIPYYFLTLGKRIPEALRTRWIEKMKGEFISPYGIASESPNSDKFEPVGVRGPVTYHMFMAIDAIDACGEHELARKIALDYCSHIVKTQRFAAFDPISGKCLSFKSNTSLTSVFIYLLQKYEL